MLLNSHGWLHASSCQIAHTSSQMSCLPSLHLHHTIPYLTTPNHTKSNYTIHIVTNEHPSFLHCSYLRSPRWQWANQSDGGIGVGSIHCIWHPHDTHHLLFPRYKHNPLSLQAQPQPQYKVSHRVMLDLQILSIFMNIMTVFLQLWIPHTINLIRRLIPLYDVCVGLKCERQNKIYKLQLYTFLSI